MHRIALLALLIIALPSSHEALAEPGSTGVTLRVTVPADYARSTVAVELRREDGATPPRRVLVPTDGVLRVELEAESRWEARAVEEKLWSETVGFAANRSPLPEVALRLRPAGQVAFELTMEPKPATPPKEVTVRLVTDLRSAIRGGEALEAICPVFEGKVVCSVPAGVWDLRLRTGDHSSSYLWQVAVPPGGVAQLGKVTMRRGASVAGFVVVEGPVRWREVRVRLAPSTAAGGLPGRAAASLQAIEVHPDPRGFFQFLGVPPGVYRVESDLAGFAPGVFSPFSVFSDAESMLREPLILRRPVKAHAHVRPSVTSSGAPWTIVWSRSETFSASDEVIRGTVPPSGAWESDALAPGEYSVRLDDETGTTWHERRLTLSATEHTFELSFDRVPVRGHLLLGDLPLAGRLLFGGRQMQVAIGMEAAADGGFQGELPHDGRWVVYVEAEKAGVRRNSEVDLVAESPGEAAEVEIRIPDTRIEGVVKDAAGNPVPKAQVQASVRPVQGEPPAVGPVTRTDAEGSFVFVGLDPGEVRFAASEGQRFSEKQLARVRLGSSEKVELVLRERRMVSGQVLGPLGGVLAAQLLSGLFDEPGGSTTVTDARGSFRLPVPASPDSASVAVLAPGFALKVLRIPEGSQEVTIPLETMQGRLRIVAKGLDSARLPWVSCDGESIPLTLLMRWSMLQGRRPGSGPEPSLTVPGMPPGNYSLCLPASSGESEAPKCSEGFLSANGELTLTIPSSS